MDTNSENRKVICFYLGKPCRYGEDAPPEEQMECSQCPVWIIWRQMLDENMRMQKEISQDRLRNKKDDLDSDKIDRT